VEFKLHTSRAIDPIRKGESYERPGITLFDIILAIRLQTVFENDYIPDGRGIASKGIPNPDERSVLRPRTLKDLATYLNTLQNLQDETITSLRVATPLAKFTKLRYSPDRIPMLACVCCGGRHHIKNCPIRHERRPPTLCPKCFGDHWACDCPNTKTQIRSNASQPVQQLPEKPPLERPPPEKLSEDSTILCHCCGGRHLLKHCTVRHEKPPSEPCSNCGGEHWRCDCPLPLKTGPPTRCPYCGGDHWKAQCEEFKKRPMSDIGIPFLPVP
jgi:hypothetical protein